MNFDPTPAQHARSAQATQLATAAAPLATSIDHTSLVPSAILQAASDARLDDPFSPDAVSAALIVEELATASASLAALVGLGRLAPGGGDPSGLPDAQGSPEGLPPGVEWPGLRGAGHALRGAAAATGVSADGARLVLCAVAVGVGRAAIAHAVAAMKQRGIRPGADEQTPHWLLADAASEIDAARLLTLSAAQTLDREAGATGAIALARSFTATAAERAVEAAIRVVGSSAYQMGSLLERLSRDARTLTLVMGTVEESRTAAAASLLAP